MALKLTNLANARIAGEVDSTQTTIALMSGHGARFPVMAPSDDWFPLILVKAATGEKEITRCTGRTGDVLTISRAQEGTAALTFSTDDIASLRLTNACLMEWFFHPGNMGAGSGLDADFLRGLEPNSGTGAGTIPVRDSNGKLPGDITGRAPRATSLDGGSVEATTLSASGNTTLEGDLAVEGNTTHEGNVAVEGALKIKAAAAADEPIRLDQFTEMAEDLQEDVDEKLATIGAQPVGVVKVLGRDSDGLCTLQGNVGNRGLISQVERISIGRYRVSLSAEHAVKILGGTSVPSPGGAQHHSATMSMDPSGETGTSFVIVITGHTGGGSQLFRDPQAFNIILY